MMVMNGMRRESIFGRYAPTGYFLMNPFISFIKKVYLCYY